MSETEHNKGTLTEINLINGSLENTSKSIIEENGGKLKSYYDTYEEQLREDGYRSYYFFEDKLYKVEHDEFEDNEDIFLAVKKENGVIEFETKYYNGGCSFDEALDEAMKKVVNNNA